jgi:hypothetical protein
MTQHYDNLDAILKSAAILQLSFFVYKAWILELISFFYYFTSCTLRALLRLQFNLNETRYFVLIVFIVFICEKHGFSKFSSQGTADHLVTGLLVTWSLTLLVT